jgi:hypothetical protein
MLAQAATLALDTNNIALYQKLRDTAVTYPDGSKHSMLDMIGWDESVKLQNSFQKSMLETEGIRSAAHTDDLVKMQADWANPNTPIQTADEVRKFLDDGTREFPGFYGTKGEKRASILEEYYKASAKKVGAAGLSNAFESGNQAELLSLNKTSEEGLDAWMATKGKNMTPVQATNALAKIGMLTGQGAAFKKMGELHKSALAQLLSQDNVNPDNAAMVKNTLDILYAKTTQPGARQAYLGAFDSESQGFLIDVHDNNEAGYSAVDSVGKARKAALDNSLLSPQARASRNQQAAKENAAMVSELTSEGLWGTGWNKVASIFSSDAGNRDSLTAREHWFENSERVEESAAMARSAFAVEVDTLARTRPHMSASGRQTLGLAIVAGRSVQTEWGPIIVPRGQTAQQYFGVDSGIGNERIGLALKELITPKEGNRVAFQIGANSELMFQERTEKGELSKAHHIDPRELKVVVDRQLAKEQYKYKVERGEGTTIKGSLGGEVTFNGNNTASVSTEEVGSLRTTDIDIIAVCTLCCSKWRR